MSAPQKLTPKQQLFVEHYLLDRNATQAAIKAGYSKNGAGVNGCKLLNNHNVKAAIDYKSETVVQKIGINRDMVLAELAKIAFGNIGNYLRFNASGVEMFDSDSMKIDALACIQEVSETVTTAGGTTKFKMYDKVKALQLLGNHLGMFNEQPAQIINNIVMNMDPATADKINRAFDSAY